MKRRRRLAGLVSGVLRVALRRRPRTAGVILAAGSSTRMGGDVPKQFLSVCGVPILIRSVRAFDACPSIDEIVIVARERDIQDVKDLCAEYKISSKLKTVIAGGDTRQKSAFLGVEAASKGCRFVAIHDAARCLVTEEIIRSVFKASYRYGAATAASPVKDTVKISDSEGFTEYTLERDLLRAVQTPQIFRREIITAAHELARRENFEATDDNALVEKTGIRVKLVDCGYGNLKITTPEDIIAAEALLKSRQNTENIL